MSNTTKTSIRPVLLAILLCSSGALSTEVFDFKYTGSPGETVEIRSDNYDLMDELGEPVGYNMTDRRVYYYRLSNTDKTEGSAITIQFMEYDLHENSLIRVCKISVKPIIYNGESIEGSNYFINITL